ncbi:homoserine kinase [Raineyella antarctica]|uniref:Homoserine kinase n=1 Tax=Raineyella antarctica TaxID=1577474 RepID=A0A1G6GVG4_9ACTN|nr:homoserine kinase [Raineyella antarctica]SDB85685.1 homoserine kinase [Raineyella antarctica]
MRIAVRVPASSANLGPGYDCMGMALDWFDEVTLTTLDSGIEVDVTGEGSEDVPRDSSHLIVQTFLTGLASLQVRPPAGLRLAAHNSIPHGRGLGSSSAAITAGLLLAWAYAHPQAQPDRQWMERIGTELEGHADNVAAVILGGLAIAWGSAEAGRAVSAPLSGDMRALAFIPHQAVPTVQARRVLPQQVSHADAAANTGRAALLVHALAQRPDLLFDATEDWLHQRYRAQLMPRSAELVTLLRAERHAAIISGAGPTVVVLGTEPMLDELARTPVPGFDRRLLRVGGPAHIVSVAEA